MLAAVDFSNNLTWALLIGWIMSVVLHEFAHGLVAHLGGDYTIRERGGLTLNPLQYIDPLFSLIIPAIIFLMGGLPLPGGVTYVRKDLLRSRAWQSAVSAAGPLANFLLFLICALPFHPYLGWITPEPTNGEWSTAVLFAGAFAWVQLIAVLFNLAPVPGLDGFGIIEPYFDQQTRESLTPQVRQSIFFLWFILLWKVDAILLAFFHAAQWIMIGLGFGPDRVGFFLLAFRVAVFGAAPE
jgi:Zn-dependent protease